MRHEGPELLLELDPHVAELAVGKFDELAAGPVLLVAFLAEEHSRAFGRLFTQRVRLSLDLLHRDIAVTRVHRQCSTRNCPGGDLATLVL